MIEEAVSITPIIFDRTRDVRVLKSQRRIDINYVDEVVVNEFFEPSPSPLNPEFS